MGALRSVLLTGERTDNDFYETFLEMVRQDSYEYQDSDSVIVLHKSTFSDGSVQESTETVTYNEYGIVDGTVPSDIQPVT